MTVETIKTVIEALEFCGKQKARELEEVRSKREQIRVRGSEEPVAEQFGAMIEESELRNEFENVVKALAEFKSIGVKLVNENERKKPFWRRW